MFLPCSGALIAGHLARREGKMFCTVDKPMPCQHDYRIVDVRTRPERENRFVFQCQNCPTISFVDARKLEEFFLELWRGQQ